MSQRVGIITFYFHNYNMGGMLQAYALQKAITQRGWQAEQICYKYQAAEVTQPRKSLLGKLKEAVLNNGPFQSCALIIKRIVKKIIYSTIGKREEVKIKDRIQRYDEFAEKIPHSRGIYTAEDIGKTLGNYDIFICGGDQIWNDWGQWHEKDSLKVFTLRFVEGNKRKLSYSASTGQADITDDQLKKLEPGVRKLDMVSVREKSSIPAIQKITDKQVYAVADPVLLLNENQWNEMCRECCADRHDNFEPYLFCYFLGSDKHLKNAIQRYARRTGVKTLSLPFISNSFKFWDLLFGDIKDFTAGPAEFVELISNAEAVLTDSYHAIIFSMIFHKPFYVFERENLAGCGTMNTRITDLLHEYHLESRMLATEELDKKSIIDKIDYTEADSVREKEVEKAEEYLQMSLDR